MPKRVIVHKKSISIGIYLLWICGITVDFKSSCILLLNIILSRIWIWAKTWHMFFNYEKCKVSSNFNNNIENEYTVVLGKTLIPRKIEKNLVERDLGILLWSGLKWVNQTVMANKATIARLSNSFTYFNAELVRLLNFSLVRPHLEYAIWIC